MDNREESESDGIIKAYNGIAVAVMGCNRKIIPIL